MSEVRITQEGPGWIAAVQTLVGPGRVAVVWQPCLDRVWQFLKANPAVKPGLNVFLYHHPPADGQPFQACFGVQVAADFVGRDGVDCVQMPTGLAASLTLRGPYDGIPSGHARVRDWAQAEGHFLGPASWEVYGHWHPDPRQLETRIVYLLARGRRS
ncbi:MAG: GyrI-like domain-containing protein [bacterium]